MPAYSQTELCFYHSQTFALLLEKKSMKQVKNNSPYQHQADATHLNG